MVDPTPPATDSTAGSPSATKKYLFPLKPSRTRLVQFAADDSLAEVHYTYSGDDYDRSSSGLRPSILGWRMGKDEHGMLHSGNKAPSRPALLPPHFALSAPKPGTSSEAKRLNMGDRPPTVVVRLSA